MHSAVSILHPTSLHLDHHTEILPHQSSLSNSLYPHHQKALIMADYTTRRRRLAGPDANSPSPPSSSTALSTRNRHPAPKTLDPTIPSSNPTKPHHRSGHFSRLNPLNHHRFLKPASKDIHMQAQSLTSSLDLDPVINKFQLPQGALNSQKGGKSLKKGTVSEKRLPKDLDDTKQEKPVGTKKKEAFTVAAKEKEGKNPEASRETVKLIGGRRSLDGTGVDLSDVLANCGVRVISVDMPPFMQIHAVDFTRKIHDSLEKFSSKTLALSLKKEFDGAYGPAWHCIVGTSFGSFVTYSVGGFLYFSMDQKLSVLLFKTTVQRAD